MFRYSLIIHKRMSKVIHHNSRGANSTSATLNPASATTAFNRASCRYVLCELSLLIPKLQMESLLCPSTGIQEYGMNAISWGHCL